MNKKTLVTWPLSFPGNRYDHPPIVEWIDLANGTMFRIFAYFTDGIIYSPKSGFIVAIERVGAFFFSDNLVVSWQYVSEKLNISESDARNMADWINAQIMPGQPHKQQGFYNEEYIMETNGYNLIGESYRPVLKPVILV